MRFATAIVLFFLIILAACGGPDPDSTAPIINETPDRLVVYTVNHPLATFAQRLGGNLVRVVFPAAPDGDPAFWSPDADTITAYQGADLILLNGAGYAKWVEWATLPTSKVIDTTAGASDRLIELDGTVSHSHGPGGEHEHGGWASTTWLDPTLALDQARAVAAALQNRLPDSTKAIDERLTTLTTEIDALDRRLSAAAETVGDEPLFFSHPVYQYFIQRYDINGYQVHWEPGVAPDSQAWSELEHLIDHHAARWMLWEAEPLASTVAELEERGLRSVVFSPGANTPVEGDWLTVMEVNARVFENIAADASQPH